MFSDLPQAFTSKISVIGLEFFLNQKHKLDKASCLLGGVGATTRPKGAVVLEPSSQYIHLQAEGGQFAKKIVRSTVNP